MSYRKRHPLEWALSQEEWHRSPKWLRHYRNLFPDTHVTTMRTWRMHKRTGTWPVVVG